jgi:16S rRNA (cytosine967-C5)-methyltransferase
VIDLCAGAGGKTLHLAALQKDKGRIIASDLYADRLKELKVRAARAGINSLALTGLRNIQNTFRAKADILLIDAPCSGSGVYGRQPDRKWIFTPEKLDHYVGLQRDLLDKHACLVKTDGYLVYATCSIIPDENEKQVEYFLSNHPEFMLVPVTNDLKAFGIQFPSDAINTMLTILPHYFKSDGFFIAKMKRIP